MQVGENSAVPHWSPTDREIKSGDSITIDMGCSYNGYSSDMTRTIFVDTIDQDIKNIYDLVLNNQQIALEEMKDGASIKIISRIVEGNFRMNGYDLIHALGHGIGMNVHEEPIISFKSEKNLRENMIIAVEPRYICPRQIWS